MQTSVKPVVFAVPEPLPIPVAPVITLPPVAPPRAPVTWWIYALIFLFAVATLVVVGYVVMQRPFAPASVVTSTNAPEAVSPTPNEPSTASVAKTYSYTSVVNVPTLSDFFGEGSDECVNQNGPAPAFEKPTNVEGKTRLDLIIKADIPAQATDQDSLHTELDRIDGLITLFAKHKLKATLYLTSAFVNLVNKADVTEVAAWAKAGNEVALTFEPGIAFGDGDPEELAKVPFGSWLLALHKQQIETEDICDCTVTAWSGAGAYPRMYQAAKDLGFTTNVDWNEGQSGEAASLSVVNPWMPLQAGALDVFTQFDPVGSIVYLPNGVYPAQCNNAYFAEPPFTPDYFSYITKSLYASLASARADRVNVVRVAVDPSSFDGVTDDQTALQGWIDWLTTVVDPYLRTGTVVSSTDSATSTAFVDWLDQNIGTIELK